jgi:hypothetical protein
MFHRAALIALVVFLMPGVGERSMAQCQLAKLVAPEFRRDDLYGYRVAVHEHRVFIDAYLYDDPNINSGVVFQYEGHASSWPLVHEIHAEPGTRGSATAVAAAEGYIAVGAFGRGLAYVYDDSGSQVARLVGHDTLPRDLFGWSVAADGQRIVVGALDDNGSGPRTGSAYLFERDPNGVWREQAKLVGAEALPVDHFGESVAISGDVVVSGAPESDESGTASGSAYVFERDPNGSWRETAKLLPSTGHGLQLFGQSVAVDNGVILVGAHHDRATAPSAGAVYVYERDAQGAWVETARLVASDGGNSHFFGISVAIDGDLAVIGAENADTHIENTGAAYVFHRQPDGAWLEVGKLVAADGRYQDEFGRSVALHGHLAVVGAPYRDLVRPNGSVAEDAGAAYVFAVGPDLDGDGLMDACLCPGDVDGDFTVNFTDLATVLHNFGQVDDDPDGGGDGDGNPACLTWPTRCLGDLDRDGDVDISDLGILLANWASVCP